MWQIIDTISEEISYVWWDSVRTKDSKIRSDVQQNTYSEISLSA